MKIALQLYSIKNISEEKGLCAALDKAKELGYEGVEFAGLFGLTPQQAKAELDKRGLLCAGFHEGYGGNVADNPEKAIDMCKICDAFSLCIPHYAADTAEGWAAFGKSMNEIGKKFRAAGIPFGYHNHRHEFEPLPDGRLPMDILLENCEPENVFFEMDTRHVVIAGVKPEEYIKRYASRVTVLHARDTDGEHDSAVGAGLVNFPAVMDVIGVPEWFVVENENFGTNEQQLADSVTYLKNTFGK
ncbi:MAG: sugar phosphate isomerase/epimerase family protein [Eubacteriales bacterium]